jgi:hypothetical protein
MKDFNPAPSRIARVLLCVLDAILVAAIIAFVANNNSVQIAFILSAFALGLLGVLSVAAWRHGFRWFFSRRALRFHAWLVVGVISVVVLFYAEENWRGKWAWAALQREAAARGESVELSSVFPPPVPDEENFALAPGVPRLLGYAESVPGETRVRSNTDPAELPFYHGGEDKRPAANWALQQSTDLAAWQKFFRQHPLTNFAPASNTVGRLAFPVAPKPQDPAADMLLALSRYDSSLALLRAANQRPKVRYPLAYDEGLYAVMWRHSLPPENLRAAAHVLCLRAVAELAQDQSEAALQSTLLALRLADSFEQQPFEHLHRYRTGMLLGCLQPVWEGLAAHRWNEAQLLTLQQRFAGMDLLAEFHLTMRGNALVMMNLADQFHAFLDRRRSPMADRFAAEEDDEEARRQLRFIQTLCRAVYPVGWLYQDKVWIYRFYERRADVAKALDPANRMQWRAEMLRATDPVLLIMVAPKLQEVFQESAEGALYVQTACAEAAAACALERCRLAQGQYPTSLDALVPAWLKQVPADLLVPGGAPLKYRREADGGFLLYSVGLNRVDDQGKPGSPDQGQGGRAPRLEEGDWVWRQPGQ